MKLLVYDWGFFTKYDVYNALRRQKIEFDLFAVPENPRINEQKEAFLEKALKALEKKAYDAVFSINFQEELATAAHNKDILYICWTYDSPALMGRGLRFETNRLFCFDPEEYRRCKAMGLKHLYHLPLAVDAGRLRRMKPTPLQQAKYLADISFVGQLYQSDMDRIFPLFDEYAAGYTASLINTSLQATGRNLLKDLINDSVTTRLVNPAVEEALLDNLRKPLLFPNIKKVRSYDLTFFLNKAVTNKERVLLLSLLSKYGKTKLYAQEQPKIPGVQCMGTVDYNTQMPLVFQCTKINLNITMRNIVSAIPQRVLDIMGCGALALTNYQEDVLAYFEDGKHLVVYRSLEEAVEKCRYYLQHEKEAAVIRNDAWQIVKKEFDYEKRLNRIWEVTGLMHKV